MDVAQRQEQIVLDQRSYAATPSIKLPLPTASIDERYTLLVYATAAPGTRPTFTATLTPKAGSLQVTDGQLVYTSAPVVIGGSPANGWRDPTNSCAADGCPVPGGAKRWEEK
jgi:Tfp pilus assembly protein PilE